MYTKNTTNIIFFFLRSLTTGKPLTGLSPTGVVTKDNSSQTSIAGSFTELDNGQYRFDGTKGDFNGDVIGFVFSGTNAIDYDVLVDTRSTDDAVLTELALIKTEIEGIVPGTPINVSRTSNIIHRG